MELKKVIFFSGILTDLQNQLCRWGGHKFFLQAKVICLQRICETFIF